MNNNFNYTVEQIQTEWEKDCNIGNDYEAESRLIPELNHKYLKMYAYTKKRHIKLRSEQEKFSQFLDDYYSGQLQQEDLKYSEYYHLYKLPPQKKYTRVELNSVISRDKNMISINLVINELLLMIEILEKIMESIGQRSFYINNCIKMLGYKENIKL